MSTATTSIGQRMATGVAWVVGARLLVRLLGVISLAVLARLLQPSDYGLIALATAFAAAIELFGAFNFEIWLVRHPAPTPAHYNTVWTLSLLRSVVAAAALWFGADAVALNFSDPRLRDVLHVLALGTLLSSVTNVGIVDFQRELRFEREFAYLGLVKFGSFCVALGVALWLRSYWALLAGIVAGQLLRVVLSFCLSAYRPNLSLRHWREVFAFSKWLLAGNVFGFAYLQSGTFLLGRLAMAESVGLYAVAREIADLASSEIVVPIRRVLLPAYAGMQEDSSNMRRGFVDVFALIALVGLPCAAGIAAVAEPLVATLLGAQWQATVELIRVLGIYALSSILMANQGPVLLALGRSRLLSMLMALGVAMLVPSIILGYQLEGLGGAVIAVSAVNVVLWAVSLTVTLRVVGVGPLEILRPTWRAVLGTLAMVALVWPLADMLVLTETAPVINLLASTVAGALVYMLVVGSLWLMVGRPAGPERTVQAYVRQRLSGGAGASS